VCVRCERVCSVWMDKVELARCSGVSGRGSKCGDERSLRCGSQNKTRRVVVILAVSTM